MNLNLRIISILSIFIVAAFVIGSACAAPVASDSQASTLGIHPGCLDDPIGTGCSNPNAVAVDEDVVADESGELSGLFPDKHVYSNHTPQY